MSDIIKSAVYKPDAIIAKDINTYLKSHQKKSLLRFITCGSVDDGKSTLIGRLLFESNMLFEDHLTQLESDSKKTGTQGKDLDFALLLDGLEAEREQGITIDVAYRFFTTEKRKFIAVDTPGHEQYTRNMITAASTAELAIILIDARKGILTQTRRHSFLCNLIGINNFILAINKMDLIEYSENTFKKISSDYSEFAKKVGIKNFTAIPVSGLLGDNITCSSNNTPWFNGSSLMNQLENVATSQKSKSKNGLKMPVQWVNRPNSNFRGFSGKIVDGAVKSGDRIRILPGGNLSKVGKIFVSDREVEQAKTGESITLTFKDEVDCSRGQIITTENHPIEVADQFESKIIWMDEEELIPGRSYYLKIGTQTVSATVSNPKYQINVNTMEHMACKTLTLNTIGVANITIDRPIAFTPYEKNRELGGFILIDKISNSTAAAGLINFELRRSQNIHWQATDIDRTERAKQKNQKAKVVWMTGLSGSGKSTIANALDKKLTQRGYHTFLLDGDNVRHGLNKDLGFTEADRIENIRRIGEVAKLMTDAGLIVITAFISPFQLERDMVRGIMQPGEFFEVFIDTPIEVAEERDVKGLYKKARAGELKNFTGIDSPYEIPKAPEIHINTTKLSVDEAAEEIAEKLFG